MTACPSPADLRRLLDGHSNGPAGVAFGAHLEGCPACQRALDRLPASAPGRLDPTADLPAGGTGGATGPAGRTFLRRLEGEPPPPDGAAAAPPVVPGYEVLGEVGRGGMGVVYRARDLALGRDVAVKLLAGRYPAGGPAAGRFVGEARVTARLQHPGIPPVHAVGAAADGRPFLAMKLIEGRTLDDLIRTDRVGGPRASGPHPERAGGPRSTEGVPDAPRSPNLVAAFEGVCQAVGYAHSRGVVHRDLKPANVMVGAFGEVQVMDWGLAKELAGPGGEAGGGEADGPPEEGGAGTATGSVLGTPAYMPPEQAAGATGRVNARSDVFGLGGILCAVLTGRPPYVGDSAASTHRLAARAEQADAVARLDACGADPGLVALCRRCLAPDPADRPADGGAVADAVAALRAAADDRARRAEVDRAAAEVRAGEQARRRRAIQWAGGAVAAVLLAGVAGTTFGMVRADAARQAEADERRAAEVARAAEEEQKRAAVEKAAESDAVVRYFDDHVFAAARPKGQGGGRGHDVTLRAAIVAGLPALATGFKDQPLVEARLRRTVGATLYDLGEAGAAAEQFERARALSAAHRGPGHPDTLTSMHGLANCYDDLGRHPDALALRLEVRAGRERALPPDHPDTLRSMNNLANSYTDLGRHADALRLHEEVLAVSKRVLPADHPDTLASRTNVAVGLAAMGRHADALERHLEALAAFRRVLPPDHPDTLKCMSGVCSGYFALGRHADSLKLHREVLAAYRRALPPDHPDALRSMSNLALSYTLLGRHPEAVKLREEVLAGRRRALPADHADTIQTMYDLSETYLVLGRLADAVRLLEEVVAAHRRTLPPADPAALDTAENLARGYNRLGRPADALTLRERTLAACRQALPADHRYTLAGMNNVAASYDRLGRPADALKLRQEVLAACERTAPGHPDTLNMMWRVASSLVKLGRGAEAVPVIDACVRGAAGRPVDPQVVAGVLTLRLQHFQGAADPAGCRATAAMWEGLNRADAGGRYDAACMRAVAARLYAEKGQPAEATADADRAMGWLAQAVAAGFRDRDHIEQDADLRGLRGRADFRALVGPLPYTAPPPRVR